MLRIRVLTNGPSACGYFGGAGGGEDAGEPDGRGVWGGQTVARLGLAGEVCTLELARLCRNRDPLADEPLTPRTAIARRVGWDVSFHAPKSVSVLYGLCGDPSLLAAFRGAVSETLVEIERDARTRVRRGGADVDRTTANLAWATFIHTAARPVNGVVDPHLHAHCLVFNLTYDPVEARFKALQPEFLYRDAPYFQAAFHARLAAAVRALGFDVYRTRTAWEVAGVPTDLLRRHSRRTALIERTAAERHISDPKEKDALGAKTRERKAPARGLAVLRQEWQALLTPVERAAILAVLRRELPVETPSALEVEDALRFAVAHVFERVAVASRRTLLAAALRVGVGRLTHADLTAEFDRQPLIVRSVDGEQMVTTAEVLAEEQALIAFARDGRGVCRPLAPSDSLPADTRLSASQLEAVRQVLSSTDRVTLMRGAAGTGKTTVLAECVRRMEAAGRCVVVLAPTAYAARSGLRREGFLSADTVARFLTDRSLQFAARGQVVWVDEAGLLGGRDAARLFHLVATLNARLVLGGDRRQHAPVPRGSVLKLLETEAGLQPAELVKIRRQAGRYREVVSLLARGQATDGFDALDAMGWVRELPDDLRPAALAADYLAAVAAGESVLVVSPTHAEGRAVTEAVRTALKAKGLLACDELGFPRLEAVDLTVAERGRPEQYHREQVVEFHLAAKGFRVGERWEVEGVRGNEVDVRAADGRRSVLPLHFANRFGVFARREIRLAVGDLVRVTKSGRAADGRRLDNGAVCRVTGFTRTGAVVLNTGAVLPPTFAHLTHGYAVTSPTSQGRTVDVVLIAESFRSFPAAGREQWYVSVSRGRRRAVVYTDDKAALREAVRRSDPRPTAVELIEQVPSPALWNIVRERLVRGVRQRPVLRPAHGREQPRERPRGGGR